MILDDETLENNLKEYVLRRIALFIDMFQKKPDYIVISGDIYEELNTNKKYHFLNNGIFVPNEYTKDMDGDKLLGITVFLTTDRKKKFMELLSKQRITYGQE
jgi:hypothetical protein